MLSLGALRSSLCFAASFDISMIAGVLENLYPFALDAAAVPPFAGAASLCGRR